VKTISRVAKKLKRLFKDEAANVTVMTGLAIIPMFLAAGAAIDTVRINREQATFQGAVDSAVLAVAADNKSAVNGLEGEDLEDRMAELEALAKQFIMANYSAESSNAGSVTVQVTSSNDAVQLRAWNVFPTTIMKLAGVNSVTLESFAEVKKAMRPVELVMVIDTTGSMNGAPMAGVKTGIRQTLDILYGGPIQDVTKSEYIRAALVPFALAVRLNQGAYDYSNAWIDTGGANALSRLNFNNSAGWHNHMAWSQLRNSSAGNQPMAWNGCVESRARNGSVNLIASDTAPGSTSDTLFPAYFAPDTPRNSSNGNTYSNEYISTSGSPNENTGLSGTQISSNTSSALNFRQQNQAKYVNRSITGELVSGTYSAISNNRGPWTGCAKSMIVPMTYNRTNIDNGITAMTAYGGTNIAEGLAWGLRAISPTEPFTKVEGAPGIPAAQIAPYNHEKWQKVMVLVTDGDNNPGSDSLNGTSYSSYGFGYEPLATNRFGSTSGPFKNALDADLTATCEAIKGNGVTLYVASYGDDITDASRDRLKACASDPIDTYEHASTPTQLAAFFDHIGQDTLNKMIYVSK
jgi:Flp pilus assembly protein TadG